MKEKKEGMQLREKIKRGDNGRKTRWKREEDNREIKRKEEGRVGKRMADRRKGEVERKGKRER